MADIGMAPTVCPNWRFKPLKMRRRCGNRFGRGMARRRTNTNAGMPWWWGARMTGAARLAATTARGAGLTTVAVPQVAWPVYAASLDCIMVHALQSTLPGTDR